LRKILNLFPITVVPIYILINSVQGLFSPHFLQHFLFFIFLMIAVLTNMRCYLVVLISFASWLVMLNTFLYSYWSFVCFLLRNISLLPIFKLGCFYYCYSWVSYTFWMLTYQMYFSKMFFFHLKGCLFSLLIVSFAGQKLFSFI
jgi:hypothetical protein